MHFSCMNMSVQVNVESSNHQSRYTNPTEVVVGQPMVSTFPTENLDSWSWCNLVTSVISLFCCNVCGVTATILAILAYVDHRVDQFEMSGAKRNAAYGFAIAAFVTGTIILIIVMAVLVSVEKTYDKP